MRDWLSFVDSLAIEDFNDLCEACKCKQAADKELLADLLPNGLTVEENYLVATNKKIEAIKSLRRRTGMGLKEGKEFILSVVVVRTGDL